MKNVESFKTLRSKRIAMSVGVASVAVNLLAVVTPLAVLMIFERVVPHQSVATLQVIGLILLGTAVLEFMLRRARMSLLTFAASRNAAIHQVAFLSRVLKADPNALVQDDPAVHLERQSAIDQLRDHAAGEGKSLAIDLPFSLFFVALIGLIGGWLILVPLACLTLVLGFAWIIKRAHRSIFEQRRTLDRRRYAFLSEAFGSVVDIKANTMERQMARRFEMLQDKTTVASASLIRFSGLSQGFGAAIGQVSVVAMGLFGAYLVMAEFIGLAELAACMLLNGRVTQPITKLLTIWVQGETAVAARAKLHEIDALPSSFRKGTSDRMAGVVECVRMQLSAPDATTPDTQQVSLRVGPGQILLVDANETPHIHQFFNAVLGQDTIAAGQIYIDGRLPREWMSHRGTGGIILLETVPAIFSGTLMENLCGFKTGARLDMARNLSTQLGLDQRVRRLPQGYETSLNDGGFFERDAVNRQLIALVRALTLQPKLLLMQEPSAILDVDERNALQQCLAKLPQRPTVLLTSPDPRLRNLADKTLRLERADAAEIKKWNDDLLLEQREYRALTRRGAA